MIASENFVSRAVLSRRIGAEEKVCRRVPGKRYYGGCAVSTSPKTLAIDARMACLARIRNVQPHSGARPHGVFCVLKPGDTCRDESAHGGI